MSSNKTDHKSPRTNVFELLPEVYRSNTNETVFENTVNHHLTKDDLSRVTGIIGKKNTSALVDRQVKEATPFRQAFQLQPTMVAKVGSEDHVLTHKEFLQQLSMMGVDVDRIQDWAKVKQFNWVPPVNMDMLVNYYDYFWPTTTSIDPPQYFTIENRCTKARSLTESYKNIIDRVGDTHTVVEILPATNTFVIETDLTSLFVDGFQFYTTNTSNVNLANVLWTTASSSYDFDTNRMSVTVQEDIAIIADTTPTTTVVGKWWYQPTTLTLYAWDGSAWVITSAAVACDISLAMMLLTLQRNTNCACNEDFGWDMGPWDDNQPLGSALWNDVVLTEISHATEADWITANGAPAARDTWYDTTNDILYQRNDTNTTWEVAVAQFHKLYEQTQGVTLWDKTVGCVSQTANQWSSQNRWIHKSQVSSFSGIKRAQVPILEYSSTVEMNEWTQASRVWKYRATSDVTFEETTTVPHRIELEPIKSYRAAYDGANNKWYLYLFSPTSSQSRDMNHTSSFVTGSQFVITDDLGGVDVYTVAKSEFRNLLGPTYADNPLDVDPLAAANGLTDLIDNGEYTGCYVTVVELVETIFSSSTTGGGVNNVRIEPRETSSGDVWMGYHVHWLLTSDITTSPTAPVAVNPVLTYSLNNPIIDPPTATALHEHGVAHQTVTVTVSGVTHIDLHPSLTYNGSTSVRYYATPNSNELRVYINDVRQYGTYVEEISTASPDYTVVGTTTTNIVDVQYVSAINFLQPLTQFDVVRLEVCPASIADMGQFSVPVRTVEDETEFAIGVAAGTQPHYVSLTVYERNEQSKLITNQYPYFNVYDVVDMNVVSAAPLFSYKEDANQPINVNVSRRIVSAANGRDFTFIQHLLDENNGKLYGYRNTFNAPTIGTYWYSPLLNTFQVWDGTCMTSTLLIQTPVGVSIRECIISEEMPDVGTSRVGEMWFKPSSSQLYRYDPSVSVTYELATDALVVQDVDPSLQTVWKNTNDYHYIPEYVNGDREPVSVGSTDGDWEILDPWVYNSEHKNYKETNFSQLVTHFSSIVAGQEEIPGMPSGGRFALTQNEFDYSVGGTIKEHNDSFDTLVSAVNVANVAPPGLIEWARTQYESALMNVRTTFNNNIVSVYGSYEAKDIAFSTNIVIDNLYQQLRFNDFLSYVYGDTTAYDVGLSVGVPNWIATVPILRIGSRYNPHLLNVQGNVELYHHDGHRSSVNYTAGEFDQYARQLISISDPRVTNGTLGLSSAALPPTTSAGFISLYGGTTMRPGVYWYRVSGAVQTLYRFSAIRVGPTDPSFEIDGDELPDGTMYYNTLDNTVRQKQGLTWVILTSGGDISPLWVPIDFAEQLGLVLLDVEQQLHDVASSLPPTFDYSSLQTTPADQSTYSALMESRFNAYVAANSIATPMLNTTYNATDPFSWNYYNCDITSAPYTVTTLADYAAASWQEIYTRWYGTPYPHLEPWKLQGYHDKPTWWDEEYLDTTGSRTWKYNHSMPIIGVSSVFDTVVVAGDHTDTFTPGKTLTIKGSTANDGTYLVSSASLVLGDTVITTAENIISSVVDGYIAVGMWENIRVGAVPLGRSLPDGTGLGTGDPDIDQLHVSHTYNYFSVNISNVAISGGYEPDALLPPYYVHNILEPTVRSLFNDYSGEIFNVDADYSFGQFGPEEWLWSVSVYHTYDVPVVAFLMYPIHFLHHVFGVNFVDVDGLQVDTITHRVYSHDSALFHGDLFDENITYVANGLNQWYANYNRFSGYDTNDEFRQLWVNWSPRQSYLFGGIVDEGTFDITTKYFDVVDEDYQIKLINTGAFKEMWVEGFEVSVINIPPAIVAYNNESQWKFNVDTLATVDRSVRAYGVRCYPYSVDRLTGVCTLHKHDVAFASPTAGYFSVVGDQTLYFKPGATFAVQDSFANDGTYTVMRSTFMSSLNVTRITVTTAVPSSIADGTLVLNGVVMPWVTGQQVALTSTKFSPSPVSTADPYFVIRLSNNTFKLAETYADAIGNVSIDFSDAGSGENLIGEVRSSFRVYGGSSTSTEVWYHYEYDKDVTYDVTPPAVVVGMQSLINMFDGYAEYQRDDGITYGLSDASDYDTTTGRTIDWQFEIERFIDWAYNMKRSKLAVADRHSFSVVSPQPTQELVFGTYAPSWSSGTQIVFNTSGTLPSPLIAGAMYYFVSVGDNKFKVSTTSNITNTANHITFTTSGTGVLTVSVYNVHATFPSYEINPTRNNIWINTPQGVLSDVISGPYRDIRVSQTIFDQHGNPMSADKFNVYRHDLISRLVVREQLNDPLNLIPEVLKTQYDYLHFGGGHFFVEGYEHVLLFNNYTVGGALIYDQFFGLNASRFSLDYYESSEYNLRPSLGGHFLVDDKFERNIEGSIVDMRDYYDTYNLREGTTPARYARSLLGFTGPKDYLDLVNMGDKSQFLFYQGMLRYKGSVASTHAYINSRRFIDAKVDEFWAHKIAEYGDARLKVFPSIKLLSGDANRRDLRLHFLASIESVTDPDVVAATENDFIPIEWSNSTRWDIYPEQKVEVTTPLFLRSNVTSMWKVYFGDTMPVQGTETIDYWFDTLADVLKTPLGGTVTDSPIQINRAATTTYIKLDQPYDDVRVVQRRLTVAGDLREYETFVYSQEESDEGFVKVNSEVVKMRNAAATGVLIFFTVNPSPERTSPTKLFDKKSNTTVTTSQMWDPARGVHYATAAHSVDVMTSVDPAKYLITLASSTPDVWSHRQVGTVWLDTSTLGYKKYYDDRLYSDINDRLNNWGTLASWADVKTYEWVASSVPPSDWAKKGELQSGDLLYPQRSKATGTARRTLFKRTRESYVAVAVSNRIHVTGHSFVEGDVVLFSTTDTLPAPLQIETPYIVLDVDISGNLEMGDINTNAPIAITDLGTGTHSVVEPFDVDWVRSDVVNEQFYGAMLLVSPYTSFPIVEPTLTLSASVGWSQYDDVDVYVNDTLTLVGVTLDGTLTVELTGVDVQEHDIIEVVRPLRALTPTEESFDPDTSDDGVTLVQWKYDYEYSTVTTYDGSTPQVTYYFWVQDSQHRETGSDNKLSAYEVTQQIRMIPTPFFTVHAPKDDPALMARYGYGMSPWGDTWSIASINEQSLFIPVVYRQAVLHKASRYITDDNRFTWNFTSNMTLRAKPDGNLKSKHEEWYLFRRAQPQNVPQELWNKLVEAMVGYKTSDASARVPSLERELYDATNGTDTRFGIGEGQAFCDKNYALTTVVSYLKDPSHDFLPIVIDNFFATHSFDTPEGIQTAMTDIYNSFSSEHVNNIWFETLYDALSTRAKYKDLMKTSWIALHGIRVLEVGDLFDD